MTGILKSAPNAHFDNQEKQTNHEALIGFSWFLYLGPDQTVAENRLISATNSGAGITASYTYDGDGNRVSKTVNGVTTDYVVDTQNPTGYAQVLAEIQNGEVVKRYTYGHDLISMERKDGSNWVASYYGYDGTGSVRVLTDSTGAVTDNYDYDAFGTLLYSSGSTPNEYLFHGERKDPETGLVYLRARYMDPAIGRFTTMDSFEGFNNVPQSLHKYVFVANDPVNKCDFSGHAWRISELLKGLIWNNRTTVSSNSRNDVIIHWWTGTIETRSGGYLSWRNNNPGNIRPGNFSRSHGAIGEVSNFATFPNLNTGEDALYNLLFKSEYQRLTVTAAISQFAPPIENDTTAYQNHVTEVMGFDGSDVYLYELSPYETDRLVEAIRLMEGWKAGTVTYQ